MPRRIHDGRLTFPRSCFKMAAAGTEALAHFEGGAGLANAVGHGGEDNRDSHHDDDHEDGGGEDLDQRITAAGPAFP